jgi:hypothetical protein
MPRSAFLEFAYFLVGYNDVMVVSSVRLVRKAPCNDNFCHPSAQIGTRWGGARQIETSKKTKGSELAFAALACTLPQVLA